jgi:hypothetical protein
MDLINLLDSESKAAQTQSLDLSFNELYDMYRSPDRELNISPEYQRVFRWSPGAQSRFIESLLLEMPVPPIYVIEDEIGKYELIDGLQRLSSYLHFRGVLSSPDSHPPVRMGEGLRLVDCDIVTALNGKSYTDLPTALQIRLKRAFVRVEVIRKSSDPRLKYHMFKRLNTGGVLLSDQQLRNCTIRLLDNRFTDFLAEMSKDANFKVCIQNLTYERLKDSYDQELVLRFFAFKYDIASFKHDVSDFLTDYMEKVSDSGHAKHAQFDYQEAERAFKDTFMVLAKAYGVDAFSFANAKTRNPSSGVGKGLVSGFSVYHFEALCIGFQSCLPRLKLVVSDDPEALRSVITSIKMDSGFIRATTGGGKNSPGPLRARIGMVEKFVEAL